MVTFPSHTLWDLDDIITENAGKAPNTYNGFLKVISKMKQVNLLTHFYLFKPNKPLETPNSILPLP